MVSVGQNELIGVIASVLRGIHHNIIVFCNISWIKTEYENKIKPAGLNSSNLDAYRIISIFIAILIIWCSDPLNEVHAHIISHADNWYFSDSNCLFFFQLKINEMVIEMKMKTIPIISFSIYTKDVFYIIVSICKFISTLINLMAVISYLNMWLWQWQWCWQVRVLCHFESCDPLH